MRFVFAALALCLSVLAISPLRAESSAANTAIFAGGCFWCVESDFDHVPGVVETVSGYTGGHLANPTYEQVGTKTTGHIEAVQITFDPEQVSYETLLSIFWRSIDPTDAGGQFCDRGEPYQTAVFALDDAQRAAAEASKTEAQQQLGQTIVTPVIEATTFWPAEDYHQDYHNKKPLPYKFYRWRCGRDERISNLWGEDAHRGIDK